MYTREVLEPPKSLIQNKKPVFGSFRGVLNRLDIRGIYMPFGVVPLPPFVTNIRIKSKISYTFSVGDFIGTVEINDIKILAYTDVVFLEKSTGKRFAYRHIMRPRRRLIPHELRAFISTSHHRVRYIRISWDRDKNRISLLFSMKGDNARPDSYCALISHFDEDVIGDAIHVVPYPSMRRCSASYQLAFSLHGSISLTPPGQETKTMEDSDGMGFIFNDTEVFDQMAACSSIVDEYRKALMLGQADVEEYLQDFRDELIVGRQMPAPMESGRLYLSMDATVSRAQFCLYATEDGIMIENLSNVNVTRKNGYPLWQPVLLEEGDILEMGRMRYMVKGIHPAA